MGVIHTIFNATRGYLIDKAGVYAHTLNEISSSVEMGAILLKHLYDFRGDNIGIAPWEHLVEPNAWPMSDPETPAIEKWQDEPKATVDTLIDLGVLCRHDLGEGWSSPLVGHTDERTGQSGDSQLARTPTKERGIPDIVVPNGSSHVAIWDPESKDVVLLDIFGVSSFVDILKDMRSSALAIFFAAEHDSRRLVLEVVDDMPSWLSDKNDQTAYVIRQKYGNLLLPKTTKKMQSITPGDLIHTRSKDFEKYYL